MHVGFAIQRLDEESARQTLADFERLGMLEEEFGDGFALAARQAGRRPGRRRPMKYLDEFSDPDLARRLLDQIHAATTRPWAIMEVCGGQTHSIIRHGIDQLLPDEIEMIHGPGCPVCVTPLEMIDKALAIAAATRGDLLLVRRHAAGAGQQQGPVPGQERRRRRAGRLLPAGRADAGPGQPGPAGGVLRHRLRDHRSGQRDDRVSRRSGSACANFSLLVSHVLVPPAIAAIMESPTCRVQAFLAAGHVCSVMGTDEYPPLAEKYGMPIVVTGFEPLDILEGIRAHGAAAGVRAATSWRTPTAGGARRRATRPPRRCCEDVFEVTDRAWRGIGDDPAQRVAAVGRATADFDAEQRFDVAGIHTDESSICRSGEVLQGLIKPHECAAFGTRVHAAQPARRDDGVLRGRLRRLLPVPPAGGDPVPG